MPILSEEPNGDACTDSDDAQCANDHCIDGYCCDTVCDQGCDACDVGGSLRTCTALADAALSDGTCGTDLCAGQAACPNTCAAAAGCLPAPDAYCDVANGWAMSDHPEVSPIGPTRLIPTCCGWLTHPRQ